MKAQWFSQTKYLDRKFNFLIVLIDLFVFPAQAGIHMILKNGFRIMLRLRSASVRNDKFLQSGKNIISQKII